MDVKAMKAPLLILFVCAIAACLAVAGTLVSAPTYELIFVLTVFVAIVALGCAAYLFGLGLRWFPWALLPGVLAMYAILDVALRHFAGSRVLDVLN